MHQDDFDPHIPEAEKTCYNCSNWTQNIDNQRYKYGGNYGICSANVFDVDACGKSITILHKDCSCLCAEQCCFSPLTEYLEEVREMSLPLHEVYGVRPGIDFPASM